MNRVLIRDIAAALDARPATVRQWKRRGKLPPESGRVGQSPWWEPDVIEPWIEQEREIQREKGKVMAHIEFNDAGTIGVVSVYGGRQVGVVTLTEVPQQLDGRVWVEDRWEAREPHELAITDSPGSFRSFGSAQEAADWLAGERGES